MNNTGASNYAHHQSVEVTRSVIEQCIYDCYRYRIHVEERPLRGTVKLISSKVTNHHRFVMGLFCWQIVCKIRENGSLNDLKWQMRGKSVSLSVYLYMSIAGKIVWNTKWWYHDTFVKVKCKTEPWLLRNPIKNSCFPKDFFYITQVIFMLHNSCYHKWKHRTLCTGWCIFWRTVTETEYSWSNSHHSTKYKSYLHLSSSTFKPHIFMMLLW